MERSPAAAFLRDMNSLFDAGTLSGLSDRQLLERFRGRRDAVAEAAFEALVLRHGPMVMRVCRNTLRDHADIQDAFQASFLVLVRKSGSIRRLDSIGSWLFGVANRVALRARVDAARRRSAEQAGGLRIAAITEREDGIADRHDLGPLLQAEIERLPEKYRAVVFLCYWEGLTHEQAATRLGCPLGTVRSRVARARSLLRHRLSRHGLEPVSSVLAAATDTPALLKARAVELPGTLVNSTVRVAKHSLAEGALTQLTSPSIAELVQKVIWSMFMTKVKTIAVYILLIGAGAFGLTLAAAQSARQRRETPERARPPVAAESKTQLPLEALSEYVVEPPDLLLVEVLEALPGQPISGERLVQPDGKISLGFYGEIYVAGLTLREVKEKVVLHLKEFIGLQKLGLVVAHSEATDGEFSNEAKKPKIVAPRDSNRVFVQLTKSKSKFYYLQGAFVIPGRVPVTGQERILDAVCNAGGLASDADHRQVFLFRPNPDGGPLRTLKIDIDQIMLGDDLSTNFQLLPGDRLVVRRLAGGLPSADDPEPQPPLPISRPQSGPEGSSGRQNPRDEAPKPESSDDPVSSLRRLEKQMNAMKHKLDSILAAIKHASR